MKITDIKPNKANPRLIKDNKFKKLCNSIEEFPKMMKLRPIVIDSDGTILGGNMRYKALQSLGYKDIPDEWVKRADELTDAEKQRFIVEDNVGFGEWDFDLLTEEFDVDTLDDWGVDVPNYVETETSKLSELQVDESIYYEPVNKPSIKLNDCVDLDLYNKKIQLIENSNLSDEQKNVMKMFAYRFIKIDFENVANYYAFQASDDEKEVIERLRLVLVDNGIDGFIEDNILKIANLLK